jgi:hypothetical protein
VHYQNNVRFGTGDSPQLVKQTGLDMPVTTMVGGMIDYLRARIADGSAEPIGTEVIDGEEYWVVEYRAPLEPTLTSHLITFTMRKSDYHIRTLTQRFGYINFDGRGSLTSSSTYDVIEEIDPAALPADFFTFESVIAVAGPDVPLTVQEFMPPPID